MRNLNIGCGEKDFPDCVNVDIRHTYITHLIYDLEKFPYPFEDNEFENIYAYDILEHLTDVMAVMEELHRILKVGGKLFIRTNNWRFENAFTDPTHKHFFTLRSFDYFDPNKEMGAKYGYYSKGKFSIARKIESGQEIELDLVKI